MNPIAFSIFGLDIRWYGVIIAFGIIVAILLSNYTAKIKGINHDILMDAVLVCLPAAIIGARLYYVIFSWEYYRYNLGEIFNIRGGGLAIHGGVIFGFGAALIFSKIKKVSFLKYADAAAPTVILAQGIGRWGNFFNQEAHGGAVSYEFIKNFPLFIQKGMLIDGVYYNPTFLYESLWNFLCTAALLIVLKRSKRDGFTLFTYIALYSAGRFIIEGMRTDSLMIGTFRVAQLISLTGILLWIGFIIYGRIKDNRK